MSSKTALIIGASSGIGRALAMEYARLGWRVAATARRIDRLASLQAEYPDQIETAQMDVLQIAPSIATLTAIAEKCGGHLDLVIINAGVGDTNLPLDLEKDLEMVDTNARSFAALAAAAYKLFQRQGNGHLAGITSIAGERSGPGIAYHASKAFASSYLEGLRLKALREKANIAITDIRPGFVNTDMIDLKKAFWVASPEKAARQISHAIQNKRRVVYVTKRWRLISWLLFWLPETLLAKVGK